MDGDIGRLKRFTEMSISPDDYGKFKIICYDFQKEIVESVAPQGMDIISYPFEDVVNAFYGVYDQFEKRRRLEMNNNGFSKTLERIKYYCLKIKSSSIYN